MLKKLPSAKKTDPILFQIHKNNRTKDKICVKKDDRDKPTRNTQRVWTPDFVHQRTTLLVRALMMMMMITLMTTSKSSKLF